MLTIMQVWDKETIDYDKGIGRNERSLYPDSPLYGVAINHVHNPTLLTFLGELEREHKELWESITRLTNEVDDLRHLKRQSLIGRSLAHVGNWLIKLSERFG